MDNRKFIVSSSPHIRGPEDIPRIMWAVVAALAPGVIWGIYVFREARPAETCWFHWMPFYPAFITILAIGTAVATEALIQRLRGVRVTIRDGSAVVTGLLFAMIVPPCVPWYVPIVGSFFAIAIGKHCFGGLGCNIWNPALIARAFVLSSYVFPLTSVWHYPADSVTMRLGEETDAITRPTPLAAVKDPLKNLGDNNTPYRDLLFGNIGGCLGETSALLLLLGGVFLMLRGYVKWQIPIPYLATVAVLGWALPVKVQGEWIAFAGDPVFHLLAGGLFLGAFFMATDMVTSPITKKGMIIFGIGCGLLTVIIRVYGGYPEGVCYSILLMNTAVPLIDRYTKPVKLGAPR